MRNADIAEKDLENAIAIDVIDVITYDAIAKLATIAAKGLTNVFAYQENAVANYHSHAFALVAGNVHVNHANVTLLSSGAINFHIMEGLVHANHEFVVNV